MIGEGSQFNNKKLLSNSASVMTVARSSMISDVSLITVISTGVAACEEIPIDETVKSIRP